MAPKGCWIKPQCLGCLYLRSCFLRFIFFFVSFKIYYTSGQLHLREQDILLVNEPVRVPIGRTLFLDPLKDLRINVRSGDQCQVTVTKNDPLPLQTGRLDPLSFPCKFGPRQVQYIHFGGNSPSEHRIQLLIRYISPTDTVIIPFTMTFKLVFIQFEIIRKHMPIVVDRLLGYSTAIDRKVLEFTYDKRTSNCHLTIFGQASGLPKYGYVLNETSSLSNIDCDQFLQLGIRYRHTAANKSPNMDYIPAVVELLDQSNGQTLKEEYFQIPVRIIAGQENTPPSASLNALFVMESVSQFIMTAITPEILSAEDRETPADMLYFNITQPLSPSEGAIVSTDDQNLPITSFYQREINELKIAYKPPSADSDIRRMFQVEFQIIDSDGLHSDPIPLMIVVLPMNTLAPIVTTNRGLQLMEGQSRPIMSPQVLEISDEDNLDDVKVYNMDGLRHGHLLLPRERKYFTARDLKVGNIRYQHDGSDTTGDNIIFKMSDGKHEVEFLFPITIYPVDDQPPTLTINTVVDIRKNELVEVSQFVLSATDIDSDDSLIRFVLQPPFSREGVFVKRQFQIPENQQEWRYENGIYEKYVNEFTQQDIADGKLFYRHIGPHHSEVITDKLHFILKDGGDPPNQSNLETFVVKVQPVDDQPPYLYANIPLQMEVDEFQLSTFRRKSIRYTDDDNDDKQLRFTVTKHPFDTYSKSTLGAGQIVYCDSPQVGVAIFTQSEINHNKICYRPPSTELGITTRIIQFKFSVEDVAGNALKDQLFTIILKPVNNQPPIVTNSGFSVFENGEVLINSQILSARDPDSPDNELHFIITTTPEHGQILRKMVPIQKGDRFSKNDIDAGLILYRNTGEEVEMTRDRFTIDVTDGVHFVPITVRIKINPVDDEPPSLFGIAEPGKLRITLEVREGDQVLLTNHHLEASDKDTKQHHLVFVIESQPNYGLLLKNGSLINRFSQSDLAKRNISYSHTGGEIGLAEVEDRFSLMLTDNSNGLYIGGNRISHVIATVRILPKDNMPPDVLTGTQLDVLEGDKAILLPAHLDAMDRDTLDEYITCSVLTQPNFGYIENIAPAPGSEKSQAGMPISAFSITNVRLGNINYVQSVHKGIEPREDIFIVQCSDGINLSPHKKIQVKIYPDNDEEPEVHVREFVAMEGMPIRIDLPILNALDKDIPTDQLQFLILTAPSHGQIVKQSLTSGGSFPVESFTLDDIKGSSTIVYEHDDSETRTDKLELLVTDGIHNVSKTIPIIIIPVDDETPRLTINNGLEIEHAGDRKFITNEILKAEDLDSSDLNITFIIRRMPSEGYLVKYGQKAINLTLGLNFTQGDIDNRRVEYVHVGLGGKRDLIKFDVTDGLNPLIDRYFYIMVEGVDIIYPEVISRGVELPEGGAVTLTTSIISGTDLNSPDESLLYTVTRAPSHGHLENVNNPGVPVVTFTQLDLAGNNIRYIHTSEDEIKMDTFDFEVTDGFNAVSRTFRITISDVDNKKPVLMFTILRLKEASNKLITPFELKAVDKDTVDENIIFTITQVPLHGNILYNYSKIVSLFTLHDLQENLISYQHDGTETTTDSFSFTVTDGAHSEFFIPGSSIPTHRPQEMQIEIIPVDNGVPQILINRGVTALMQLGESNMGVLITNKILRSHDPDSLVDRLLYTLTTVPKHGYIANMEQYNRSVGSWTQDDIDRMKIMYLLKSGENATSDSFFFKVTDQGGNTLANQPFHLHWAWINFEKNQIYVNETDEKLEVTLKRRGYLGETCFVTINVLNGTANVGKDVSRQYAQQVQFNPGQTEMAWNIRMKDDTVYEESETFQLELVDPVLAILDLPMVTTVTILDAEDESTAYILESQYKIEENVGTLSIPVHRSGDLTDELLVICSTQEASATGTIPNKVLSYSDYITRAEDHNSVIRFDRNEDKKFCNVMVIDDSIYEEEEVFYVILSQPMGGRLGTFNTTKVHIKPDPSDEPVFYFGEETYVVDESDKYVEVRVWRTGTDLSRPASVTVRTRRTEPMSAEAGMDYTAVNRILDFAPGTMIQMARITILDDLGRPQLEGIEKFEATLKMPVGGTLGEPTVTTILINDTLSDLPKMEFKEPEYEVNENVGIVTTMIKRSGDIDQMSSVRCFTRQASAEVMMDFIERPDSSDSVVIFQRGEREKACVVYIVNDTFYETEETFRLVLGTPESSTAGGATLGGQTTTLIRIKDREDKPVIKFENNRYTVNEPIIKGDTSTLRINVIREGDTSVESNVRVSTKDGSAKAGTDYNPFSKALKFEPGVNVRIAEIVINYDDQHENSEVFSVHLSQDSNMVAEVKDNNRALIYIEENNKLADVIFPVKPIVVSLRDYDDVANADKEPVQGYPLVCITPCSQKHPNYSVTNQLCEAQEINDTLTKFRWRVSAPSSYDGITSDLRDVESNTFFATTRGITLDSIYFGGGSQVQCIARAVNLEEQPGKELGSDVINISTTEGLCMPRVIGSIGADPFTAKLRYTGPDDRDYPNSVRLSITIPHRDGMLPVISTKVLSNFELTLSRDGIRTAQHRCSNILDYDEVQTRVGFITNATKNGNILGEMEPYQFSPELRSETTLRFYRNLDLESCLWEFISYYNMSELVSYCGGKIETDGQVVNLKQSYVSLRIPLYVSYIFHSPVATGGWQHYDLSSQLKMTFVYDTSILWQDGVSSPTESGFKGYVYPTGMRLQADGTLAVNFRTETRFRGQFVLSHPGSSVVSRVTSPYQPGLTFTLSLLRSEPSFENPEQAWEFISNMAVKDYSGLYLIHLIPCTTSLSQEYTIPIRCNPNEPVTFELPIRFQQVSDPVAAKFTLNTGFHLIRKRELWLVEDPMELENEEDSAFAPGDKIYGRIDVDPVQSLGDQFKLNIEKVFLCSGKDGYIPKYNPDNQEYGCVAQSPNLQYVFKILDKGAPHTCDLDFQNVPFEAQLAIDDPKAKTLTLQSGADGFSFNSQSLFQVDSGRQWFLHAIYTLRSKENSDRGIGKRSVDEIHHLIKRAVDEVEGIGKKGKGTNMVRIVFTLDSRQDGTYNIDEVGDKEDGQMSLVAILVGIGILLLLCSLVAVIFIHKRRKNSSPPPSPAGTITVLSSNGQSKVMHVSYIAANTDNTEI
ncbi:hypothetical protein ACJMK2_030964 [Sinanodonta woodiana]|uniref:Cadherin domain-containing protein n=1 Tax=Sinanodonta woodiana TaxID=1069815 RepID=A0ABD3WXD6_SINWO